MFLLCIIKDETPIIKRLNFIIRRLKKNIELLARERGIKNYESMSRDKLLSALKSSQNKNNARIEKIREKIKKLQHKFSREELKET